MKTFRWRGGMADDETHRATSTEDPTAADYSPARSAASYRSSTNSSVRGVGGNSSRLPKSPEGSPNASWKGSATADEGVGAAVSGPNEDGIDDGIGTTTSNKKMLKIGANVRFRGDVMECNTVVLCGRLQGFVETQRLTVKEGGKFVGDAKVEDAEVYGSVEGTLESTSKICVRSTGNVTGTVIYRTMLMEEGGEVDGTLKCSNKSSRKARNEAVGDTDAVDVAAAETTGKEDESPSPPSPSPQWRQRKKIDVERGGMAVAPTRSTPFAEAVPPEKTARSRPPGLAPLAPAMGSSGGGLSKTLPAAVVWPPSTPSAAAAGVSSPRQDLGRGGAKYMGPVKRVAPRRGLSLPAGSPSRIAHVSAPSPKRPPGLQGAEASEMFSAEEEFSPESTTSLFASHTAPEVAGKKSSPSSSAEKATVVPESGTSVAARVGTWPPASPANSKTWNRQPENKTPSSAAGSPPTVSPAKITPKSGLRKTFVDSKKPPPSTPSSGQWQSKNQNQNQSPLPASVGEGLSRMFVEAREVFGIVGGFGAAVNGKGGGQAGGGSKMVDKAEPNVGCDTPEKDGEEEGAAAEVEAVVGDRVEEKQTMKACEAPGCFMEACWGDPRFRPRYCARHKKQGSKLMDPVEVEEGDEAALPEGSLQSSEKSPSADHVAGLDKGMVATAASADAGKSTYDAFQKISLFGAPSKNSSHGGGTQSREQKGGNVVGGDGDYDEEEDLEDDEDEDEGWGNGGADPSLVVNGALGGGSFLNAGSAGSRVVAGSGKSDSRKTSPLKRRGKDSTKTSSPRQREQQQQQSSKHVKQQEEDEQQQQQEQKDLTKTSSPRQQEQQQQQQQQSSEHVKQQEEDDEQQQQQQQQEQKVLAKTSSPRQREQQQQQQQKQEEQRIKAASGGVELTSDAADMADVQARIEVYARLAPNKSQPPSKTKQPKVEKRPSGIADFYGRGEGSDEDEKETVFTMDKGMLLSQAAEAGTHTEDGQLRPQASQERDQQKLAHLMKVGKLGAVLRGRGAMPAVKRR